ncbi:50S ribosomal protein L6 [Patescibacteria group bacterium]|nr:50S ribosomal protein L6 [Patescibacteria group bacterium]
MSRVGKKPIIIPSGVAVSQESGVAIVKGPKGELRRNMVPEIDFDIGEKEITAKIILKTKRSQALWGLYRALLQGMVDGVTKGFEKKLEIEGIGYKAVLDGNNLVFSLGLSHPVRFDAPLGIQFKVEKNVITVSGIDKELVGEIAARIRRLKPPEPYKGKGIHYQGEHIRRKTGKKATATAG